METSTYYDSNRKLLPDDWYSLSDQDRIRAVMAFHAQNRIEVKNIKLHSAMHVIVEDLLTQARDPMTRALNRLVTEGLSRHDAIHALAAICWANPLHAHPGGSEISARQKQLAFNAALDAITAKSWVRIQQN